MKKVMLVFGTLLEAINDVLTRPMEGETDNKPLIPCNYKLLPKDDSEGQKEAA